MIKSPSVPSLIRVQADLGLVGKLHTEKKNQGTCSKEEKREEGKGGPEEKTKRRKNKNPNIQRGSPLVFHCSPYSFPFSDKGLWEEKEDDENLKTSQRRSLQKKQSYQDTAMPLESKKIEDFSMSCNSSPVSQRGGDLVSKTGTTF